MDSISQSKSAIQTLLSGATTIGIIVSEHQTVDVLAAALSLHLAFQDSGKTSQIISKKEPIVEHSFLVGIDQLTKSFTGTTKTLTVSFPYHDGDIEKVSYNIEGDRLNVNLFAEEQGITFTEKDIQYIHEGSAPQVIFTIGVTSLDELAGITDPSSKIINIDNNLNNSLFGTVPVVNASFSSLSEIVAKLAVELGLQVEFDVAQNLLDGIAFATQDFSSPKTSPVAFEMIGVLMQKGAIRKSMKDVRSSADTSLSMLNKTPAFAQAPAGKQNQSFGQSQPKPFVNNQAPVNPMPSFNQQLRQPFESTQGKPQPVQNDPRQPQTPRPMPSFEDQATVTPVADDIFAPQTNGSDVSANIPTEDEAPSDWFTPKVFKSNKSQQ